MTLNVLKKVIVDTSNEFSYRFNLKGKSLVFLLQIYLKFS